jgi:hypothetical protein
MAPLASDHKLAIRIERLHATKVPGPSTWTKTVTGATVRERHLHRDAGLHRGGWVYEEKVDGWRMSGLGGAISGTGHFRCTIAAVKIGPLAARDGRGAPHRRTWRAAMLEGKTRIPPVDVETLPDDLRETLDEQRKLRGAPLYPYLFYARNPAYFRAAKAMWAALQQETKRVPVTLRALLNRRVASWNGCEF